MPIHGFVKNLNFYRHLYVYGSDNIKIEKMVHDNPDLGKKLHKNLPFIKAEVVWSIRNEMARNVEDVLARRVRALFLDARASIEMAPEIAEIIAKELGYDQKWIEKQVAEFIKLARGYLLTE